MEGGGLSDFRDKLARVLKSVQIVRRTSELENLPPWLKFKIPPIIIIKIPQKLFRYKSLESISITIEELRFYFFWTVPFYVQMTYIWVSQWSFPKYTYSLKSRSTKSSQVGYPFTDSLAPKHSRKGLECFYALVWKRWILTLWDFLNFLSKNTRCKISAAWPFLKWCFLSTKKEIQIDTSTNWKKLV